MTLHHSAMPFDDLPAERSIRFRFRGDRDLVTCLVSWEALDRLEGKPAASAAERLARFEQHRMRIEAAALRRLGEEPAPKQPLRLEARDILEGPAV